MADLGKILIRAKGTYNSSNTYYVLDAVRYNGKLWCCLNPNGVTGVAPSESADWTMWVQDGSGGTGSGDMLKSTYDTDDDGVVDSAETLDGLTVSIADLNTINTKVSDNPAFTQAQSRSNIVSGESFSTLFGKIKKWFADLKDLAFIALPNTSQTTTYLRGDGTWQPVASGGHTMIDTVADIEALTDGDDDYVVNGYAIKQWSNTDDIQLLVAVSADDDGIGTWEDDDDWETSGVRTGWIQHASLHGILSDDDVLVEPVFKVPSGNNNAVSAYAMRVDDAITGSLGGVAMKFNAPITANGYAGIRIRHLRTNTIILTP